MKLFYGMLFFGITLIWSCSAGTNLADLAARSPVNFDVKDSTKVIYKTYNTSFEKLNDKHFVFRKYFPTTSVQTFEINYSDIERTTKNGEYIHRYDNDKIWTIGQFKNDEKDGEWKSYHFPEGSLEKLSYYDDGVATGTWSEYRTDSTKWSEYTFNDEGELHGNLTYWNKEGEVSKILIYEDGELLKTKTFINEEKDAVFKVVEKMPVFGDDCIEMKDEDDAKACSDVALLKHIYTNIKYPAVARENNIVGSAFISFVVEKDGSITDVAVLNGVCEEIQNECIRVVESLTKWQPGYQNDEPVRVQFNLPIRFSLK